MSTAMDSTFMLFVIIDTYYPVIFREANKNNHFFRNNFSKMLTAQQISYQQQYTNT